MFTEVCLEAITPFSMLLIGLSFTVVLFFNIGKNEREKERKRKAKYHYLLRKLKKMRQEKEVKEVKEVKVETVEESLPPLEQQDVKIE